MRSFERRRLFLSGCSSWYPEAIVGLGLVLSPAWSEGSECQWWNMVKLQEFDLLKDWIATIHDYSFMIVEVYDCWVLLCFAKPVMRSGARLFYLYFCCLFLFLFLFFFLLLVVVVSGRGNIPFTPFDARAVPVHGSLLQEIRLKRSSVGYKSCLVSLLDLGRFCSHSSFAAPPGFWIVDLGFRIFQCLHGFGAYIRK